ncbi:MAG: hypothetical protein RLZZ112_1159, partial [Verrucomicrobiota bacterium]
GQAFCRSAESSPPSGAGFFKKEEFSAVLGTDQSGWDDLGIIKNQKVGVFEELGKIPNMMIPN